MTRQSIAVADFETKRIRRRPHHPPKPVGLSLKIPGDRPRYYAWGHPSGNNCTKADAKRALSQARRDHAVVYHNAAFDCEVSEAHFGLKTRAHQYHDTMFLAFLDNPRGELHLKELGSEHLGIPATEQEKLRDWILENVPGSSTTRGDNYWGNFIAEAPAEIAAPYANEDVNLTDRLYRSLAKSVRDRGMWNAYERELKLMPIVTEMERAGIPIDVPRLEVDIQRWREWLLIVDAQLRRRLDAPPTMNPGSGAQVAKFLEANGLVSHWVLTPKGNKSTKADVLMDICDDKDIALLMRMRAMLQSAISTFAENWLQQAYESGGLVMPVFNQVRSYDDSGARHGTRTGRFSSEKPNFQNITNPFDEDAVALLRAMQRLIAGFQPPNLRDYVVPFDGYMLLNRDYSQQELRILAHYEDDVLLGRYLDDPSLDCHELVRALVHENTGVLYPRKHIKITNFGILYGMGIAKLAKRLGIRDDEARSLRGDIFKAIPGIRTLSRELMKVGRRGDYIRTWGGRLYNSEPPRQGRRFEYKLLNILIQGSAADCTKEAMINCDTALDDAWLMLQVHDELMAMAPRGTAVQQMKRMKEAMEAVVFDVPMLSDGKMSDTSWFQLEKAA